MIVLARSRWSWFLGSSLLLVVGILIMASTASAHEFPGSPEGTHSHSRDARAASGTGRNVTKLGGYYMGGYTADLWAHKGYAYVGTWGTDVNYPNRCPAKGVRILSLASPSSPRFLGRVASIAGTSTEDVVVKHIETAYFKGDLLVTGVQACRRSANVPRGISIWNVTNPYKPVKLGFWSSGTNASTSNRGVHELYLFQRGGRAYIAAAVPYSEKNSSYATGKGDFRLVDVTNPRKPYQVGQWGARRNGGIYARSGQRVFGHSAYVNAAGTRAIASFWDAGAIYLDISDVSRPRYVGRTVYPAGADGESHSAWFAQNETLLLTPDEDFKPENGWGYLRVWDVRNPKAPKQIGRFTTPNSLDRTPPDDGIYSVHNVIVRGQTAYMSWYSDGIRVADLSDPRYPRQTGYWVPPATRDPYGDLPTEPMVWGVVLSGNLILASDMNGGLYVLKYTPPSSGAGVHAEGHASSRNAYLAQQGRRFRGRAGRRFSEPYSDPGY